MKFTSAELHRLISRHFSTNISAPTIRRYIRQKLEWVAVRTRFGPMISERNKLKRQEFAQMCLDEEDTFDNVIWSDESSVQLTRHAQTMRVKTGRERVRSAQRGANKVQCGRLGIGVGKADTMGGRGG